MLPSAEKFFGDANFLFQQDVAPARNAKTTTNWFADHDITVLDWPGNSPDLYCQEEEEKQTSITAQQGHRLITSTPHCIDAVICAKRSKY